MPKYEVINKGKIRARSDIPVKADSYVIARGGGERFILLKLRNKSRAVLNAVSITVSEYGADGSLLRTEERELTSLTEEGGFVFPEKIPASDACRDIGVEVTAADYGSYSYSKKGKAAVLEYNGSEFAAPAYDASPRRKKLKGEGSAVAVRKFRSPILWWICAILIFACMAVFMWDHVTYLDGTDAESFRSDDVSYTYLYKNDEVYGVAVSGYSGISGTVTIPAAVNGYSVLSVQSGAFTGNSSVKKVTINGNIPINARAFEDCTNLTSVSAGGVTTVGADAFFGCTSLESVDISSATTIGNRAFYGCTSLAYVSADNLNFIGSNAFYGCTSLGFINLGNASIGTNAFYDCTSLTGISFRYVNIIDDNAFYGCTSLSIVYAENATYIGEYAFYGCTSLTEVQIEGGAELSLTLGGYAFADCSSLSSVMINRTTTYVYTANMFNGCSSIAYMHLCNLYTGTSDSFTAVSLFGSSAPRNAFELVIDTVGTISSSFCSGLFVRTFTVYSLGSSVLGSSAFENCGYLTAINLPIAITYIDDYAFYNSDIMEVDLSEVTYIGSNAFAHCTYLTEVTIYNNITIGAKAFYGCTNLAEVTIYRNINVGTQAFYNCENLKTINDYCGLALTAGSANYGYLAYYAENIND